MCIIAVKKPGVPFPSEETIENMWYSNPDGAGIMYTDGSNRVTIDKGYMTLKEFTARLEALRTEIDVDKEAVVFHFRIGTSGGNVAQNTHPFPISNRVKDLRSLRTRTKIGIAHNGIIHIKRPIDSISDTMEYIRSKLYPIYTRKHWFFKDKEMLDKIERQITSKMVFLEPSREVQLVGHFITEKDGMIYSNTSYEDYSKYLSRYYKPRVSGYYGTCYDYDYSKYGAWDDEDGGYFDPWDTWSKSDRHPLADNRFGSYLNAVDEVSLIDDSCYIVSYESGSMLEVGSLPYVLAIGKYGDYYSVEANEEDDGYIAVPLMNDLAIFTPEGLEVQFNKDDTLFVEVDESIELDPFPVENDDLPNA